MPANAYDWRDLVSPKVGLVRNLSPQIRGSEEPQPPHLYTATLSNFDFRLVDKQERLAAGKGRTEAEAKASAIGEAVERYCAYHWDPARTFLAKLDDLQLPAISPTDCVLYSEEQYASPDCRYRPWDPAAEVTWLKGVELPGGGEVALPASLIYLIHPVPRPEDFFTASTSNGLAAGPSLSAAVLSGLSELMERDALLVTWMNRLPTVELEIGDEGSGAAAVRRHYGRSGVEVRAFLMRTDLPSSVVLAMALDEDPQRPATLIGMGCDLDPSVALDKAVYELCQARPSESKRYLDVPPKGRLERYEDVKELEDHPAFLCLPERRNEFEFLWSQGEKARPADLPNPATGDAERDLQTCAQALAERGYRVAYYDLTTPDVASCGYHVARAIAAGLQPIHFGWGQERLGGRRLFELPHAIGLAPGPRTPLDLNPCPHPLA